MLLKLLSVLSQREKFEWYWHPKSNLVPKFHNFSLIFKFHDFSMHGIFFQSFSRFSRACGNPGYWLPLVVTSGRLLGSLKECICVSPYEKGYHHISQQWRLRRVCISMQSGHSLCCLHTRYTCISHVIRKPVDAICEQQRCRSACASTQSDQRLCCSLPRYIMHQSFLTTALPPTGMGGG